MTVVLENHFDSIVVDTSATASKCIEHLKEQKWSSMTFLPLDTISARAPEQRCTLSLARSISLILTHTHTHTHSGAVLGCCYWGGALDSRRTL